MALKRSAFPVKGSIEQAPPNRMKPKQAAKVVATHGFKLKRFCRRVLQENPDINPGTLTELEESAEHAIRNRLNLRKPRRPRPSWEKRYLEALAKSLGKAANVAERLGEHGMLLLFAASNANTEEANLDPRSHVEYLTRLARHARRAAVIASARSRSARDNNRGRPADQEFNDLVVRLMSLFQETLGIRPYHAANRKKGFAKSLFDWFVEDAIATFAPDVVLGSRKIEEAVRRALPSRDIEYFTPPPLPEG